MLRSYGRSEPTIPKSDDMAGLWPPRNAAQWPGPTRKSCDLKGAEKKKTNWEHTGAKQRLPPRAASLSRQSCYMYCTVPQEAPQPGTC